MSENTFLTAAAIAAAASVTAIRITVLALRYRASQRNADRAAAKATPKASQ